MKQDALRRIRGIKDLLIGYGVPQLALLLTGFVVWTYLLAAIGG